MNKLESKIFVDWFISENPSVSWADVGLGRDYGGTHNGYVIINSHHPWYGKDYSELDVDVHGGLTFSTSTEAMVNLTWIPEEYRVPGYWIYGFDTLHMGDTKAKWPKERVEKEAGRMAEQFFITDIRDKSVHLQNEKENSKEKVSSKEDSYQENKETS